MNPIERILKLARAADAKIDESCDAADVLPYADEALSIIDAYPELRNDFESMFFDLPNYVPKEFVGVCMHVLGWPNVEAEYKARWRVAVAQKDWRAESAYRHFLEAFDPGWKDAEDFYPEYFKIHRHI